MAVGEAYPNADWVEQDGPIRQDWQETRWTGLQSTTGCTAAPMLCSCLGSVLSKQDHPDPFKVCQGTNHPKPTDETKGEVPGRNSITPTTQLMS